jgi:hypothetical protein
MIFFVLVFAHDQKVEVVGRGPCMCFAGRLCGELPNSDVKAYLDPLQQE